MGDTARVVLALGTMLVGIALLIWGTTELTLNARVVAGGLLMVASVGWMARGVDGD